MNDTILIAGGGPGGLAAAVALARKGLRVRVFERHPELRAAGAGLTLQVNAVRMLDRLGLADAVIAAGERLAAGGIETADGRTIQHMDFDAAEARHGRPGVAIERPALSALLAAAVPPGALRFGAGVTGVRQDEGGVVATLSDGTEERGAALVGADGIHSAVRRAIFGEIAPRYAGYTCWRGLAPRASGLAPLAGTGAAGAAGAPIATDPGVLRARVVERWGVGRRFGIVPVGPTSTYWFATLNAPAGGADGPDLHADLLRVFADFAAPVADLITATPAAAILRNDIVDLPILPRWTSGRVALLGDAAHAMTPNMGQGACQAIEDALLLADRLAATADVPAALAAYEAARKDRAVGIVKRSEQMGRIAQWENPVARALRDAVFRWMPQSLVERQLDEVYGVEVPA